MKLLNNKILSRKKIITILFFIVILLINKNIYSINKAFILHDNKETYQLTQELSYYIDQTNELKITDIITNKYQQKFKQNNKKILNFGYSDNSHWIRFKVINNTREIQGWNLFLKYANIHFLEFFKSNNKNKIIQEIKTGLLRGKLTRDIDYHRFVFKLNIEQGEENIYYLKMKSTSSLTLLLNIVSNKQFNKDSRTEFLILGIFYTIFIVMFVYNLLVYLFSLRDVNYLYYFLFVLFYVGLNFTNDGLAFQYLWGNNLYLNKYAVLFFLELSILSLLKFSDQFLSLRENRKNLHYIFNIMMTINFIVTIFSIFLYFFGSTKLDLIVLQCELILIVISLLIIAISSFILWLNKYREARYFFAASIWVVLGAFITIALRFGILPSNSFTEHSFQTGNILFVLLLSLALADRINILKEKTLHANVELKKERNKLKLIMDGLGEINIGINIVSIDYEVISQNKVLVEKFGDLSGHICYHGYRSLNKPCEYCKIKKSIENRSIETVEVSGSDGNEYEIITAPFENENGEVDKAIEVIIDITDRKKAEKALVESERNFRAIFDQTFQFIGLLDLDGKIIKTNQASCDFIGVDEPEIVGEIFYKDKWWRNLKEEQDKIKDAIKKSSKGEFVRFDVKSISKEDEIHVLDFSLNPVKDENGNVIMLIPEGRDITFLKEIEKSFIESEERYRTLFDESADAIMLLDENSFIDCNKATLELFGFKLKEKFIGMHPSELSPEYQINGEKSSKLSREMIKLAYKTGGHKFEWKHKKADNSEFYAEVILTAFHLHDKEFLQAVVRDITLRKQAEEQLRQAQKMETVGTLAGGIAHDFNNILGGILGTVSLMTHKLNKESGLEKDKIIDYLYMIKESGLRAADMVRQLLTLSRKQVLSFSPVDLNHSIKNVVKICKRTIDKSIKIETQYLDKKVIVNADPTQLEQVLLNLCVNAGHAMTTMKSNEEKWGGTLTITIEEKVADKYFCKIYQEAEEINYWKVEVRDTGVGISKEILSKIFNPFFSTKTETTGTGLGLSMVYGIIKQHQGFIDVYSEVGIGTAFTIFLPVYNEEKTVSEVKKDIEVKKGEGLVLVADDEDVMREIAKDALEECGYKVILAKNGEECVKLYEQNYNEIKAVVLDMSMPVISGKDAFLKMKNINPEVKVLLSSGYRKDDRVEESIKLGVKDFIQKPYSLEKLSVKIYNVINS